MQKAKKQILPVLVSTLAIVAFAMTPALAKDSKYKKSSQVPVQIDAPKVNPHDSQPGPAWKTVGGTVKHVEGDIYTVEDYEGNQMNLRGAGESILTVVDPAMPKLWIRVPSNISNWVSPLQNSRCVELKTCSAHVKRASRRASNLRFSNVHVHTSAAQKGVTPDTRVRIAELATVRHSEFDLRNH